MSESFTLTPEQVAIVEAARDTTDNLLISALAGAAKTSTLVLISRAVKKRTLCLAFNKRIAEEMKERLPLHCEAKTLNALGHAAWGATLGRRLTLDFKKTYRILSSLIEGADPKVKKLAYDNFSSLQDAINEGKGVGWVPNKFPQKSSRLMDDEQFFGAHLDDPLDPDLEDLVVEASIISLREAFSGTIDFNDQILMPTVFSSPFESFSLIMIDEAQDLSPLNRAMLRRIVKQNRLIAVGDACQSIYGFRGADEASMEKLRTEFSMRELHLTISFRCPSRIVEEAQWRAPHMKWPEWAMPGLVSQKLRWTVADLPEDAVILCRNNAPLFSMAIALLRRGRYPELVGNDVGKSLIKLLKKLGPPGMLRAAVLAAIDEWEEGRLRKTRNEARVHDQAACLRVFAENGPNLGAAIAYAEKILATTGPVKLMTIHKSKGLEFPHVFILNRDLIRTAAHQQERNLLYVAQTRAKSTLTYINSEDLKEVEDAAA